MSCRWFHEELPAALRSRQPPHLTGQQTQQLAVALLAVFDQQLHAQTDPQHRLSQGLEHIDQPNVAQLLHRDRRGTDAGKDDVAGGADAHRVGAELRVHTNALAGTPQRAEVCATDWHHDQIGRLTIAADHSTPLLLGTATLPPRAIAVRRQRPTAL